MPTPRRVVEEVRLRWHCKNKRRFNDDHDYVRMTKPVQRGDGANNEVRDIKLHRCSFCGARMIEGDVDQMRRARA